MSLKYCMENMGSLHNIENFKSLKTNLMELKMAFSEDLKCVNVTNNFC